MGLPRLWLEGADSKAIKSPSFAAMAALPAGVTGGQTMAKTPEKWSHIIDSKDLQRSLTGLRITREGFEADRPDRLGVSRIRESLKARTV